MLLLVFIGNQCGNVLVIKTSCMTYELEQVENTDAENENYEENEKYTDLSLPPDQALNIPSITTCLETRIASTTHPIPLQEIPTPPPAV